MPKVFLHYPEHTFQAEALASLAGELTTIGLACEKLPGTPVVRSTVWVFAHEYRSTEAFIGGATSSQKQTLC